MSQNGMPKCRQIGFSLCNEPSPNYKFIEGNYIYRQQKIGFGSAIVPPHPSKKKATLHAILYEEVQSAAGD